MLKQQYTKWLTAITFLRGLHLQKKNFNCHCKKYLNEVEIVFNNISREYVLEIGGNWM